ncbi:motility protein A [Candidatus Poribacteria bacterium]|nr:motility protein A [Candidatus Poribacteria bacterium]
MDISTVLGIVAGVGCVLVAILLGGDIFGFINIPSLMIVAGGTIAATLINYPLPKVLSVFGVLKNAFFAKERSPVELINLIVQLADKARREGLINLENSLQDVDEDFLKRGLQLAADGVDPRILRNIMETELDYQSERHEFGQDLFNAMAKYSPAFGMIGTLIGLIQMLRNLDDPTTIGPSMAVALITTFYGALFANLIFIPIAGKLKARSDEEMLYRQIILEGVLLIQAGDNPRMIAENLKVFLPPKLREQLGGDMYGQATAEEG